MSAPIRRAFGDGFSTENVHTAFTPADERFFEGKHAYPERLVELDAVESIGPIQMAAVRVRPVQYEPSGKALIYYPDLRYTVKFDIDKARRQSSDDNRRQVRVGMHLAEQITALLARDLVVSAKDLLWPGIFFHEEVPHVIITDNHAWPESVDRGDGTSRSPDPSERGADLAGDMAAEFERLAEWKTRRGVRSRVVTVSDIVDGRFGDFTEGGFARDLQEVVRNFIKYIHDRWDTFYILLGGDLNVVPMRRLVGASTYKTIGCGRQAVNPPPEYRAHVPAGTSAVKLFPGFTPNAGDPLSTMHGGVRIPFDREAGSGRMGWYFTSEADFTTRDRGFVRLPSGQSSRYVIVEGPLSVIDDDYYWVRDVNSIPSDFYYASLVGPGYSIAGKHDFDGNNNGIYGQTHWDAGAGREASLDDVDFWSDVWVGRASVESGDQARGFVDKVMTYERLATPDGEADVDTTYLQKVLYASAYWGREWQSRQTDTTVPPVEGHFTHVSGSTETRIRTKFDLTLSGGTPSHRLVARSGSADAVINYNTAAGASSPGWYFTTDDTYGTQSGTPTRYLRVRGPEVDVDPDSFFWDPTGMELAVMEKENLRGLMNGYYPGFNSVERHYEDYFDLSTPPPLVPLSSGVIRAALDNGVHFASLSGHGSSGGCCGVSIFSNPDFTNNRRYFIMFANSCSTARPDGGDSLGEISVMDPDGGAVAYVGNTRYGWIGVGDNYEEFFWGKLSFLRRPGPAAGLRLATGGVRQLWTFYTQTLFGDPEMPVWTEVPQTQEVVHPSSAVWGGTVNVTVRRLGSAVAGHRVTLMGGWSDSSRRPSVYASKTTNSFGQAGFQLPASGTPVDVLTVTVTQWNIKPYIGQINVTA